MAKRGPQRIRDLGELGLIEWINKNLPGSVSGLLRGIGDDAAVLRGGEIITTDMLVEGVHFNKKWQPVVKLGRKALNVSLSDIAAMGGEPRCAFLSLAMPPSTQIKYIEQFMTGFGAVCRENGMALAGGDVTASPGPLIISVTVIGRAERPVLRSGARPGDILFVSGTLGEASLALKFVKRRGPLPGGKNFKRVLRRLIDPQARIKIGRQISRYASAMIDVSDGLATDLNHLCSESKVGALVDMEKIPISQEYIFQKGRMRQKKGIKLYKEAIYGGEDYELLFTVYPTLGDTIHQIGDLIPITEIGVIVEEEKKVMLETPEDFWYLEPDDGFMHFK